MGTDISAAALRAARQYAGLTQTEAANRAGIRQADLSLMERGLSARDLGDETAERLASALGFLPSFFTDGFGYREPSRPMQRASKTGTRASQTYMTVALANIVQRHIGQLLRDHVDLAVDIPELSMTEFGNAGDAARALRGLWGVDREPIDNLTALCESHGVIVYRNRFATESIVGFTMDSSLTGQPIVFVNSGVPTDRYRLTLSHELGHIVRRHNLAEGDDETAIEREAWEFAGEFMAPASELRADARALHQINLQTLAKLKRKWGMSMAGLAKRLHDVGVLTPNRYQSVYVQLSRAGYRRHEPIELPVETESILRRVFEMLREDLGFDLDSISSELGVTHSTFKELYGRYWGEIGAKLRLIR